MRKWIYLSLIFIFLTCLFTFPACLHITDKIIGAEGDNYQFLGFQYLTARQLNNGVWPFGWTNYWRYPVGFNFATGYDSTIFILIGLFISRMIDNPATVYNVTILILLTFNGALSYIFFEKITESRSLGLLGAIIYGYSFYSLARMAGHPNLIFTSVIPFFAFSLINLKEKEGNVPSFVVFTLSIVLIFLSSLQYLLLFLGILIILIPVLLVFDHERFLSFLTIFYIRRRRLALSLIMCIGIFMIFNSERFILLLTNSIELISKDYVYSISPKLSDFLLPNDFLPSLINHGFLPKITNGGIESVVFLGYVEMIVFIFFLIKRSDIRTKTIISIASAIFLTISLGFKYKFTLFYPYYYLINIFPYRGIPESGRFYIILYFFITLGVLFYLKSLNKLNRTLITLSVAILVILERVPTTTYLSNIPTMKFIGVVRDSKTAAVADIPILANSSDTTMKMVYDLYSVYYQKPIINGYLHWSGDNLMNNSFVNVFSVFECGTNLSINDNRDIRDKLREILLSNNIRIIVFHKDLGEYNSYCSTAIENINIFLHNHDANIYNIYEDKSEAVYQLN